LQRLLRFVRLSSERARQAVRRDCSFAKKRESPPALLVVVQPGRLPHSRPDARNRLESGCHNRVHWAITILGRYLGPVSVDAYAVNLHSASSGFDVPIERACVGLVSMPQPFWCDTPSNVGEGPTDGESRQAGPYPYGCG
jgi:hypothetical protein